MVSESLLIGDKNIISGSSNNLVKNAVLLVDVVENISLQDGFRSFRKAENHKLCKVLVKRI